MADRRGDQHTKHKQVSKNNIDGAPWWWTSSFSAKSSRSSSHWSHFGSSIQRQVITLTIKAEKPKLPSKQWRVTANQSEHSVHAVVGCSPLDYSASVWHGHMVPPNEEVLSILLALALPTGRPHRPPPSTPLPSPPSATFQLIRNSRHIVGPLCKRKSPWITEAASFCSSQSSAHCGKLINQAEALQKDFEEERSDCPKDPLVNLFLSFFSSFFFTSYNLKGARWG